MVGSSLEILQEDEGNRKGLFFHFLFYFPLFFLKDSLTSLQTGESYDSSVCEGNRSMTLYLAHFNRQGGGFANAYLTLYQFFDGLCSE